jgi:hypothetical protein
MPGRCCRASGPGSAGCSRRRHLHARAAGGGARRHAADRGAVPADRGRLHGARAHQAGGRAALSLARAEEGRLFHRQRAALARRHHPGAGCAGGVDAAVAHSAAGADPSAADLGLAHLPRDELRRAGRARQPRGARRAAARAPAAAAADRRAVRLPGRGAQHRLGLGPAVRRRLLRAGADRHLDLHTGLRLFGALVRALLPRRARAVAGPARGGRGVGRQQACRRTAPSRLEANKAALSQWGSP